MRGLAGSKAERRVLSRLHVAKADLLERIRDVPAGTVRSGLRFAGSCAAFMTIHLPDPARPDVNLWMTCRYRWSLLACDMSGAGLSPIFIFR